MAMNSDGYVAMDPVMSQPKYEDQADVCFQPMGQQVTMISTQPTTTVIQIQTNVNFPRGIPRDWSTPLCGCFEDVGGCLMGWFCFPCYECHVATKMGESCCTPCCYQNTTTAMRVHFRGRHNLQGTLINDACVGCWCRQCALCQISREIDNMTTGRAIP
ncbi:placenta-specific gene 8 protein-like isoform X1 [Asterias rubens]|uniref:placenta-specific gene 8 protein-like isoform X1 n=2 Tax=Asterias rubens TaxID=7604 RepID=UPI0014551053|nr:placenta-specific gene 8 protein-like isoform X1 [Asterias rubens]